VKDDRKSEGRWKEEQKERREEERRIEEDMQRTTNEEKGKALSCTVPRQFAAQTAQPQNGSISKIPTTIIFH
jgi:hypothetical protein